MSRVVRSRRRGISRRLFVAGGLATSGLLLRSLATGLPPEFLARQARAQVPGELPQTLVLATSSAGDPINANAPGTYVDGAQHPEAFAMPVMADYGGQRVGGAAPWAELPEALRARLAFVHYATRSPAHTDYRSTMGLHGAVRATVGNGGDMFASMISSLTGTALAGRPESPLQTEPLPLAPEELTTQGRPLQTIAPADLTALFAPPDEEQAVLEDLRVLRADTLDRLYSTLRAEGTPAQRGFVDRYLRSAEQARQLGEGLGAQLAALQFDEDDLNGPAHQLTTATILAAARVSPVISVKIPFGGDNHQDTGLVLETEQTISGVAHIGSFWEGLVNGGIQDEVTFALINVFGRRLTLNGTGGRNHNREHAVTVAFGAGLRGGVFGGVEVVDGIEPSLPLPAADGGDPIGREQSLEAVGVTLGIALGHAPEVMSEQIRGGRVIAGLLA